MPTPPKIPSEDGWLSVLFVYSAEFMITATIANRLRFADTGLCVDSQPAGVEIEGTQIRR